MWRDVSDELPDADEIVIVHAPNESDPVWLGYWDDAQDAWYGPSGECLAVTHWMSLPDEPRWRPTT